MRIALLQLNMTIGDLAGNARKIADSVRRAHSQGAALCVAPELAIMGYPPRDLLFDPEFIQAAATRMDQLALELSDCPPVLVGTTIQSTGAPGNPLYNCAALLRDGKVEQHFLKTLLPTYDVFDEARYFKAGHGPGVFDLDGRTIAVTVCEDIWNDSEFWTERRYDGDPMALAASKRAHIVINLSASPFTLGKQQIRRDMLGFAAGKYSIPIAYVNQVGGNDDLIFAGRSMAFGPDGTMLAQAPAFKEDLFMVDIGPDSDHASLPSPEDSFAPSSEAWRALVLGTRDYVHKCGFSKAILGLSGGIDSALTAAVAVEALGAQNVTGVLMPSPHSSQGSIDHSLQLAANLGIQTHTLPIGELMDGFDKVLTEPFTGLAPDVTEENIQARIRGNLLMAMSNKLGAILLTTGNKSELAVGYCTIYGDMSGGLAVISDVPKTLVYDVCRFVNETKQHELIPTAIIDKPPSAELRPDQKDQDSLPPYDVLDPILDRLIVRRHSQADIVADGFDPEVVARIAHLLKVAEFKRKQAAPGLKITDRAFGTGWRMPLASRIRP